MVSSAFRTRRASCSSTYSLVTLSDRTSAMSGPRSAMPGPILSPKILIFINRTKIDIHRSSSIRRETVAPAISGLYEADLKLMVSPWASSRGVPKVEMLELWPGGLVAPYDVFSIPLTEILTLAATTPL